MKKSFQGKYKKYIKVNKNDNTTSQICGTQLKLPWVHTLKKRENNFYEWSKLPSQEFRGEKQNMLKQDKGKK